MSISFSRLISRRLVLAQMLCSSALTKILPFGLMLSTSVSSVQADDVTKTDDDTLPRDQRNSEIVAEVNNQLVNRGIKTITGLGPVNEEGDTCIIFMVGKDQENLPETLEVKLSDQKTRQIKLDVQEVEERAVLLTGTASSTFPPQFGGPLMGGDPVWNNMATQWGTITFAADTGSPITIEGNSCANQCVSCSHVLNIPGDTTISAPNYLNSMSLTWDIGTPSGMLWQDAGGAKINSGVPFTALMVRGLGVISCARQPTAGIRVSKYGATTGLTSGLDAGVWLREIDSVNHPFMLYSVRVVNGSFGRLGDSGAAVLDAARSFVGIVFSGTPSETYYLHALPNGQSPPNPRPSTVTIIGL